MGRCPGSRQCTRRKKAASYLIMKARVVSKCRGQAASLESAGRRSQGCGLFMGKPTCAARTSASSASALVCSMRSSRRAAGAGRGMDRHPLPARASLASRALTGAAYISFLPPRCKATLDSIIWRQLQPRKAAAHQPSSEPPGSPASDCLVRSTRRHVSPSPNRRSISRRAQSICSGAHREGEQGGQREQTMSGGGGKTAGAQI